MILEPKNLPVTIDPGGPESIQNYCLFTFSICLHFFLFTGGPESIQNTNNLVDENDEYEDIIMEIQMNRSRGSLRRSSGGSFRY